MEQEIMNLLIWTHNMFSINTHTMNHTDVVTKGGPKGSREPTVGKVAGRGRQGGFRKAGAGLKGRGGVPRGAARLPQDVLASPKNITKEVSRGCC